MNTPTGSKSFQRRNPHLFGGLKEFMDRGLAAQKAVDALTKPPKRIRQSSKPLLNKLEQEWWNLLREYDSTRLFAQSITFKLANGLRYTPDIFSFDWPVIGEAAGPTAWEVKGPHAFDGSLEKVKMLAHAYPEIRVILAWKDKAGAWQTQRILP